MAGKNWIQSLSIERNLHEAGTNTSLGMRELRNQKVVFLSITKVYRTLK